MSSVAPPRPSRPSDIDAPARALQRFRQVFTAARAHYQQVEKQVGIGGAQVWALGIVAAQPGLGVGGLARAMHVHQSTASNLVRGLTERGLVVAAREGADRRAVQLRLLPAGIELLAKVPGPYTGLLPQALGQLDAATTRRRCPSRNSEPGGRRALGRARAGASCGARLGAGEACGPATQRVGNDAWRRNSPWPFGLGLETG